jgi:hypothetical protein
MKNFSVVTKTNFNTSEGVSTNFTVTKLQHKSTNANHVIDKLVAEDNVGFYDYLYLHGLSDEHNLLMLPSNSHYFYDFEDLKEVRTLINQKKLNLIKQLNDFLSTVYNNLSPKTNFIGCFSDRKTQKEVSLLYRLFKKLVNFFNSRIEVEINKEDICRLLESQGFKILDMKEINGLTYFLTHN